MASVIRSSTSRSAGLFALLVGLGYLGNYFHITLFFGADILFGSIAGLIIVSLYGLGWGLFANLIISSHTYFLWGHPYAIITFCLESVFVGLFLRFKKSNLLLIDGLFWLLIGIPLNWVLFTIVLPTSATAALFVLLKQAVNGLFNALFASIAINYISFQKILGRSDRCRSFSFHESTFNLLVALVLIPSFLIVFQDSRDEKARIEKGALSDIEKLSQDISNYLTIWHKNRLHVLDELAKLASKTDMSPSSDLQHDTEIYWKGFPDFKDIFIANEQGTAIAFQPFLNEKGEKNLGKNFADRFYFKLARQTKLPRLSESMADYDGLSSSGVVLSVPVIRKGSFAGLVCAVLDLAKIHDILDHYGKESGLTITLVDSTGRIIATTAPDRKTMGIYGQKEGWELKRIGKSVYHWFPNEENQPEMVRWVRSFYVEKKRVSVDIPWTLIVESPLAPLQKHLYSTYIQDFSVMAAVAVLALLLAHIFHRWPARPLQELVEVTTNLPRKLLTRQRIEWPQSSAAEIESVIANFRSMAWALEQNFQNLRQQSAELARSNEELRIEIEERKLAEKALIETTNVLQGLIQASPLAILVLDQSSNVKVWNRAAEETFGWSESEVVGRSLPFIPEGLQEQSHIIAEELKGRSFAAQELRRMRKDGSTIDVNMWNAPLLDARGEIVGTICLLADMTETRKNQEALRESEAKYRKLFQEFQALLDAIPDEIALLSPGYEIIWANRSLSARIGKGASALVGYACYNLLYGRNKPCPGCPTLLGFNESEAVRTDVLSSGGRTLEIRWVPIKDEAERVLNIIEVVRDITEQRNIERQLRQAQKMEAIGTLAGGIAHDFNNILGIISGYVELAQMSVSQSDGIAYELKQVLKACGRAKSLVNQILTFSRQNEQEREPIEVGLVIKEALKLLRASIPATIEIHQDIESKGIAVADPTQIHQVVMNLCSNAQHAMSEKGGILTVTLKDADLDGGSIQHFPDLQKTGSYLHLSVSDTGHGMKPSILERIFDPFFTTKGPREGTGLGLAVVHGIVKGLGGIIEVHSHSGIGTTFDIFIPQTAKTAKELPDKSGRQIPVGSEKVLFVDDEEALAFVGAQSLKRLGYDVTTRTSSLEALEIFKNFPSKFDLVVTDLAMPNMTGLRLAEEILTIRPDLPVILCTGFSEAVTEEKARTVGIRKLLVKPVRIEKLAEAVREACDRNSGV